jgi:hypothetical protein
MVQCTMSVRASIRTSCGGGEDVVQTWGSAATLSQNVDTPDVESDIQGSGNGIRHLG